MTSPGSAELVSPARRGFVLQPTYRYERGRPVLHVFGTLENGESFLIRDDRCDPYFFIRQKDADRARAAGVPQLTETTFVTLDTQEPVVRVTLSRPADTPALRKRLEAAGISCYEADVRFAMRYLIDRRIRSSLSIRGESRPGPHVRHVFHNPEIAPLPWRPQLKVLSFDIETDPTARRLLSVSLYSAPVSTEDAGVAEVFLLSPPELGCPASARPFPDEAAIIRAFCARVRELDPDVLTGWNIIEFDFPVLQRIAQKHNLALDLGREPGAIRLNAGGGRGPTSRIAQVPGRVVLDGIRLLRGAFVSMESYALDAVAREVLGEGKTVSSKDRGEEILRMFEHDREKFVEYNLRDSELVVRILDKLRLVELTVERCLLTGLPPDRVTASIAAFDFLYLTELRRRGLVAPSVGERSDELEPTAGGHVLQPEAGLYDNVLVFDFKSLYPSLIRTFQIDPVGLLGSNDDDEDPIEAPNGARFRREPGILPGILDELFPRRDAAKADGNAVASQAIKILMNSFYGVLGAPACRFHSSEVANAITGFGRELLLWSKDYFEDHGHQVIYGDTDSLFIESGQEDPADATALGERLCEALNHALSESIEQRWRVESRLELQFELLYVRLHMPAMRHSTEGARKRYVGQVQDGDELRVVFRGMEAVRRDWTHVAHRVQKELYKRLFADQPLPAYLKEIVEAVRTGELDHELVYRKALRKRLAEYTSTTPPHVAAARKMKNKPGRVIRYVMTTAGPEPEEERVHPLDHEHYIQKQIRPIAEPVLALLGLDFHIALGGSQQLELF